MLAEFGGNADAIAALKRAQDDSDRYVAAVATSSLYKADPPPEKSPVTPPPVVTTP